MSADQPCVLIGVTGCIAVYKACEVVRGLQKAGVRVKIVMTEHACEFVGPTTFRALTHEPVAVDLFDNPSDPIHHISLAQECDVFMIAPCTANVMAKVAHGIADDLLTTTALATTAPLMIAPACNVHMYEAAATQENMETLRRRGVEIVEGEAGYLACGDVGRGRLAEPEVLVAAILRRLADEGFSVPAPAVLGDNSAVLGDNSAVSSDVSAASGAAPVSSSGAALSQSLAGKTVLVTAGPTVEPLDSVRYLSNYSSGKMGYAIAEAAAHRGARVVLVSGPVSLSAPADVEVVPVKTACDMLAAAREVFSEADIAVFSAAVADMRPAQVAERKLKKGTDSEALSSIQLVENPDILATLAAEKRDDQFVVGFAAETNDVIENAQSKLVRKHADLIVANQVGEGKAFGTDDNKVWFVSAEGCQELPSMSKPAVADALLEYVGKQGFDLRR